MSEEVKLFKSPFWIAIAGITIAGILIGCCLVAIVLGGFVMPAGVVLGPLLGGIPGPSPVPAYAMPTVSPMFMVPAEPLPSVPPTTTVAPTDEPAATLTAEQTPVNQPSLQQDSQGRVVVEGIHLDVADVLLDHRFPAGCTDKPPACTNSQDGYQFLSVHLIPVDLPEGHMLSYKSTLGTVAVELGTGEQVLSTVQKYEVATGNLTIGFEVPDSATGFVLRWPGSDPIALTIVG